MKRLAFFVLLIVVLVAAVATLPLLIRPEQQRAKIEEVLATLLHRPVVIGQCSFGYWPPTLRLGQIAVLNDQKEPFLQIETLSAPLSFSGLLRLKILPEEAEIKGWSAVINRKPNGQWDDRDWWPRDASLPGAKMSTLRRVNWKQGEIHWVDSYASAPQELVLSLVEGSWNPRPETLEVRGAFTGPLSGVSLAFAANGQFFANPQWTGDLEVADQAHALTARLTRTPQGFELKSQASTWRLSRASTVLQFLARLPISPSLDTALSLDLWQLSIKESGSGMAFEHSAQISGGQSELKGTLTPETAGPRLRLEGAVSAVPVEALLLVTGENLSLSGKLTGITQDFGMVFSSRTSSTIEGRGSLELQEGRYEFPASSLKRLAKAKSMPYLKKKYLDSSTGIPFSKLSVRWQAKNGIVTAQEGLLVMSSVRASGFGRVDLERKGIDVYTRIDFREKDAPLKALIPTKYQSQPAFGRLQGGWKEWSLRAIPASKLPAAARLQFLRASTQK